MNWHLKESSIESNSGDSIIFLTFCTTFWLNFDIMLSHDRKWMILWNLSSHLISLIFLYWSPVSRVFQGWFHFYIPFTCSDRDNKPASSSFIHVTPFFATRLHVFFFYLLDLSTPCGFLGWHRCITTEPTPHHHLGHPRGAAVLSATWAVLVVDSACRTSSPGCHTVAAWHTGWLVCMSANGASGRSAVAGGRTLWRRRGFLAATCRAKPPSTPPTQPHAGCCHTLSQQREAEGNRNEGRGKRKAKLRQRGDAN